MINNNTSSNVGDNDEVLRNLIIFPYIKSISNKIIKSINKFTNMIGYRCLQTSLINLLKFIKTKIRKKTIMSYTN